MTIPAGTYTARAVKGSEQYGRSKQGTPQIGVDLEFVGGEVEGQTATTVLFFTDKTQEWSFRRLRALGWQGSDLADLTGIDANEVPVRVRYETYEGKEQMRVEVDVGGGRMTFQQQMTEQDKRQFAAQFKGLASTTAPKMMAPATGNGSGGAPKF